VLYLWFDQLAAGSKAPAPVAATAGLEAMAE
jgi:hypothetical protein